MPLKQKIKGILLWTLGVSLVQQVKVVRARVQNGSINARYTIWRIPWGKTSVQVATTGFKIEEQN